jgi:hypothetical protein
VAWPASVCGRAPLLAAHDEGFALTEGAHRVRAGLRGPTTKTACSPIRSPGGTERKGTGVGGGSADRHQRDTYSSLADGRPGAGRVQARTVLLLPRPHRS